MEPSIREFFKRLVTTISLLVLWMSVNIAIGIRYNYAFFEDKIQWSNIVFYVWVLVSLFALIWFYVSIWKKPIEHLND